MSKFKKEVMRKIPFKILNENSNKIDIFANFSNFSSFIRNIFEWFEKHDSKKLKFLQNIVFFYIFESNILFIFATL